MNIHFSTISFNGGMSSETPQKPKRRISAQGSITEPIDNGDPRTAITTRLNGKVMPTPFEDCFEKMSFEEPVEDNMWRDAQYQDDFERVSKYPDDLTPHIIFERPFIDQYYSEDDIPLADSLIRNTLGFRHIADVHLDIDTQMDIHDRKTLARINYNENILPRILKDVDYATLEEFAKIAAEYKESGYSPKSINRAIERCYLKGQRKDYGIASINLFEFLIENPGLRSLVVAKTEKGGEIFDKACANYFNVFHKYLPDRETIKSTLDLCKTDYDGTQLVNRKLCEIVILTRQKSAQGIKDPRADYSDSYYDVPMRRFEKYIDKSTPLTSEDIELIKKLKPNNILDDSMYEVAKTLLSNKMTVEYVLENIDRLGKRKSEINKLLSNLNEITLDKDKPAIGGIRTVLNDEFKDSVNDSSNLNKKSLLFNSAKRLIKKGFEAPEIALVLSKIRDINKRIPLSVEFTDEFISVLEEKNDSGKIVIGKTLADILTKLVLESRTITDVDREIISLIKKNKSQIPTLPSLVNGMLNRTNDKDEVLTVIKEKITAEKSPKKVINITTKNKNSHQENPNCIEIKGRRINIPKGTVITISNGKMSYQSTNPDDLSEKEKQDLQFATMLYRLLIPDSTVIGSEIINIIESSKGKEKQMWLDFVESKLNQGFNTTQILSAIRAEKQARKDTELEEVSERYDDGSYISQVIKERFSNKEILDIEAKLDSQKKPKRTIVINGGNNQITNLTEEIFKKNLTEEEIKSEIAKIEKELLGSARMLEMTDEMIIQWLKKSPREEQPELIDLVNKMLKEWRSSKEILIALRQNSKK